MEIEILVSCLAFAGTHVLLTTAGRDVGAPLASTEISLAGAGGRAWVPVSTWTLGEGGGVSLLPLGQCDWPDSLPGLL